MKPNKESQTKEEPKQTKTKQKQREGVSENSKNTY